MSWKCMACGNRIARQHVPSVCPLCGSDLLVQPGRTRSEADPNAETLFSSWLRYGLERADRRRG